MFIHLTIYTYDILGKTLCSTNHIMVNNLYIFLHITLVTSLSNVNLTPNFLECNYVYLYYKCYKLYNDSTNSYAVLRTIIQTLDKISCYTII